MTSSPDVGKGETQYQIENKGNRKLANIKGDYGIEHKYKNRNTIMKG